MKKHHARLGFWLSLASHTALFSGLYWLGQQPPPPKEEITTISMEMMAALLEQPSVATAPDAETENEEPTEVAPAEPLTPPPDTAEAPPQREPEVVAEPKPLVKPMVKPQDKAKVPPKPKEVPKTAPKDPPKKREHAKLDKPKVIDTPKEKPEKAKPLAKEKPKAIEKANTIKQGIVEKAVPNAVQGIKAQAGSEKGSAESTLAQGNANRNQNGNANVTQQGATKASSNEISAYLAKLHQNLQRRADNSYPQREKMMRKMGRVGLSFSVSPSGQVVNVSVVSSSGNSNLDAAALKAAQSTHLHSPPPAGLPHPVTVTVSFSL